MKGLIKLQRIFLLTTLCLMLINSISALTTYAEFSDGSKIKTLEGWGKCRF